MYISFTKEVKKSFRLSYIINISKVYLLTDQLELSLDKETPLRCKYIIEDDSYMQYFIATKIDDF